MLQKQWTSIRYVCKVYSESMNFKKEKFQHTFIFILKMIKFCNNLLTKLVGEREKIANIEDEEERKYNKMSFSIYELGVIIEDVEIRSDSEKSISKYSDAFSHSYSYSSQVEMGLIDENTPGFPRDPDIWNPF